MSRKLTPKQVQAAHLLAAGGVVMDIARELKLRRETLSRWKKIPEFQQEIEKVTEEWRDSMRQRLLILAETSINTLKSDLEQYKGDPKRIQTALNVLKSLGIAPEPPPNASKPAQKNKRNA